MIVKIPSYDGWKYSEVVEILAWKDGAIYQSKTTSKCVESNKAHLLNGQKYYAVALSLKLLREATLTLNVLEPHEFV
jgi:hypothetical protein